jgi:hypothetical protein
VPENKRLISRPPRVWRYDGRMRARFAICILVVAAACGGKKSFESICDNQVPPPVACMTECDPAPGAPNTCPGGFFCSPDGFCDAQCTADGNQCGDGYHCTPDGRCIGDDECVGLECNIVDCAAQGKQPTSISGTVFAPNGTLPLFGVTVYVPNTSQFPLPPFADGLTCARCDDPLPGSPITSVQSDESGHFSIVGVPSGTNIPLIITIGKFRRQITIPTVAECTDNALGTADTRLPKNHTEGDIPKIAITTGSADSMECLPRKLGIDDAEITTSAGPGRIHMYAGNGVGKFNGSFAGGPGQALSGAEPFWNSLTNLSQYDVVILSCEGAQLNNATNKTQGALDAMKAYADAGGRVFASHWHNIWIGGNFENNNPGLAPAVWNTIGTWTAPGQNLDNATDVIDEVNNPKGAAFATWMLNAMASTTPPMRDLFPVIQARVTSVTLDKTRAEQWVTIQAGGTPQMFQFTTPNEAPPDTRCGKVVFTDMHVSGMIQAGDYPDSCVGGATNLTLTPQEKALAFMFFDINSCVGAIF